MLKNACNQFVQILLMSYSFKSQIRLAIEFEHLHLLALITDYLTASWISVKFSTTLVVNSTDLNVTALSTTFRAECIVAIIAMQGRIFVHSFRPMKVIIIVDLIFFGRIFNEVIR
jgi:hypothetical protein